MKKKLVLVVIFSVLISFCFATEWISPEGQKLTFINMTDIKFKENSLVDLGSIIARWKDANFVLSINNQGNALCEIVIIPDNYNYLESCEWVSWLYSWFIKNIDSDEQKNEFMDLGFYLTYCIKFSRGTITQYGALRKSGYVKFYDNISLKAGSYEADSTDIYDWYRPNYNSVSKSWNSGYLYRYIIGDFESIKDFPVPDGLDASFKKDYVKIPSDF